MKNIVKLLFLFALVAVSACKPNLLENIIDKMPASEPTKFIIKVDGVDYSDCSIDALSDVVDVTENKAEANIHTANVIQPFFVGNDEGVFLMARGIPSGKTIFLDSESTTEALLTLHPIFSFCRPGEYESLVNFLKENKYYDKVYQEVDKLVKDKKCIYDEDNEALTIALANLFEDIFGEIEDLDYNAELQIINNNDAETRATYDSPRINPTFITADITGSRLTLRTVGCTPSYYGTVVHASGLQKNYVIPSRSDFGLLDFIRNRTFYGDKAPFDFTLEGEYRFMLSRTNAAATLDFYMRVAGSILSTLGLQMAENDGMVVEISKMIANAITAAGSGVSDTKMDVMDWVGIAYGAVTDYLSRETSHLAEQGMWVNVRRIGSVLGNMFNYYNKFKGSVNTGLRLAYALSAPENINFCLCHYQNEVTTCCVADLTKVSGDKQVGFANAKLFQPLTVYVTTVDENEFFTETASYHRVKYEVTKGGGKVSNELASVDNDKKASVTWTLGASGEQEVRAVVVDIITGKEISEPVYFTATLQGADVTVKLTWTQHTGKTDIDLHVVDPFGERIFFGHPRSESAGFLDVDDVVGPGPEHIHWDDAPAGTYKIYVHYYPNEDEDKSVVSYTVLVTAGDKRYRPATGSISYNQMVPIGQFTIGDSDDGQGGTTRSIILEGDDTPISSFVVPKKK